MRELAMAPKALNHTGQAPFYARFSDGAEDDSTTALVVVEEEADRDKMHDVVRTIRRGFWTWREVTLLLLLASFGCVVVGLLCTGQPITVFQKGSSVPQESLRNAEVSLAVQQYAPPTLFCFALMMDAAERSLLETAARLKAGLFACDDHMIFSNYAGDVWGTPISVLYNVNLECEKVPTPVEFGGQGKKGVWSAANTRVFKIIWRAVIQDGRWSQHDWIAKLDPDTVFLPWNVKPTLQMPQFQRAQTSETGGYLENCPFGMYGAVEVLSQKAVQLLSERMETCPYVPQEDVFMRICLKEMGVPPIVAHWGFCFRGCDRQIIKRMDRDQEPIPDGLCLAYFKDCQGHHAAFHAFKTPQLYEECYWKAIAQ